MRRRAHRADVAFFECRSRPWLIGALGCGSGRCHKGSLSTRVVTLFRANVPKRATRVAWVRALWLGSFSQQTALARPSSVHWCERRWQPVWIYILSYQGGQQQKAESPALLPLKCPDHCKAFVFCNLPIDRHVTHKLRWARQRNNCASILNRGGFFWSRFSNNVVEQWRSIDCLGLPASLNEGAHGPVTELTDIVWA